MIRTISAAVLLVLPLAVLAAGGGGGDSPATRSAPVDRDWLRAQEMVDEGSFEQAIPMLLKIVRKDDTDADAYNLLGFTHRKTGQLDAALKYYKKALAIDPKHRGAHEYIGEAYLEMGDLASAKQHLSALDKSCFFGCTEHDQLKAAIAKYETRR